MIRKSLLTALAKLGFVVGGVFLGFYLGFYLLFTLLPSGKDDLRAATAGLLPGVEQSREPGPRIIFRLDDVEQGVREEQVFAILSVFERHEAPIDVGIIPRVNDRPSHALPGLKPYIARGIADVSVHGFTHRYHEFHTGESGTSAEELATGLQQAIQQLVDYYGVRPVAFLVPYDVFDEPGYEAVREAGFRIISSQWQTDSHRGTQPVDFSARTGDNGLYRLPAVDDAVAWDADKQRWGDFQPLSNLQFSVQVSLDELGVAVVSLHPAAFQSRDGETDSGKLAKLEALIEEVRSQGRIATFRNWYCTYASANGKYNPTEFCS